MRIVLIDRPRPEDRPDWANRFAALARILEREGHEMLLLDGAPPGRAAPPILTGLNRAGAAAPMIEAHELAHYLASRAPDLVIAPLRGGILQGILMARACREAFTGTRVAVWADTPSRTRFLREENLPSGLLPLVADALERQIMALADAIILPSEGGGPSALSWGRRGIRTFRAELPISPLPQSAAPPAHAREFEEIVFEGPLLRHRGVVEFIAVMERLASDGLLAGRTVTFVGPVRPLALGVGRDWLGFRAANWSFPFRILDKLSEEERRRYLTIGGRLGVAIAHDPDELMGIRRSGEHHVTLLHGNDPSRNLTDRLEGILRDRLLNKPIISERDAAQIDWPTLVKKITEPAPAPVEPPAPVAGPAVTVCVLHRNRLTYLAQALDSIPDEIDGRPVELLVVDNASDVQFVEEEIRKLAGPRRLVRVIRFAKAVPQAFAYNRAAAEARAKVVVFLDDDNYFAAAGVERMARAVDEGGFDVAVTALETFDEGDSQAAPTAGRVIFLGAAHSVGLFFNAFGDTAMAVRRDAFLGLGGFHDPGYSYSHLDWVTLAKAQAAGLRIGALQWPAVRYRRNIARADVEANKIDQEGARFFVFEAYERAFDAEVVARYGQKLQLDES
jgi:hypothetical protein